MAVSRQRPCGVAIVSQFCEDLLCRIEGGGAYDVAGDPPTVAVLVQLACDLPGGAEQHVGRLEKVLSGRAGDELGNPCRFTLGIVGERHILDEYLKLGRAASVCGLGPHVLDTSVDLASVPEHLMVVPIGEGAPRTGHRDDVSVAGAVPEHPMAVATHQERNLLLHRSGMSKMGLAELDVLTGERHGVRRHVR